MSYETTPLLNPLLVSGESRIRGAGGSGLHDYFQRTPGGGCYIFLHPQSGEPAGRLPCGLDVFAEEESGIGTELLQMEARTPRYSPYRFPEREKLQRRLGQLSQERRRFKMTEAEKLDGLHNRLLSLLSKHRQVTLDD